MSKEEVKMNAFLDKRIIMQLPMTSVQQQVKFICLSKVNEMLYLVSSPLRYLKKILKRCSEEQSSFEIGGKESNSFCAVTPLSSPQMIPFHRQHYQAGGKEKQLKGRAASLLYGHGAEHFTDCGVGRKALDNFCTGRHQMRSTSTRVSYDPK